MSWMKIYNTLTRSLDEFIPVSGDKKVGMYCCGPTVYDYTHLGHLWKYTMDDVIRRTLSFLGYDVTHVMNITDVGHLVSDEDTGEDKLEKGARKSGKTVWEVAQYYTEYFNNSMQKIGVLSPHIVCKATDHIADMVALIERLEVRGYAYRTTQAVYFDTSKFADYGALSRQQLKDKKRSVRHEVVDDPEKRHPQDFALWFKRVGRFADHTMHWESPWGDGFPGWHIECSAMSMRYLGEQFDIHTGGIDHIPVHHANEIAQSEGATGRAPFVKYWVHHNFVQVEGQKMSKSLRNFLTIDDVVDRGIDPHALRLLFLQSHYRSELNFSWDALGASQKALRKLRDTYQRVSTASGKQTGVPDDVAQEFAEAIADDFNTARGLGLLWRVLKASYPDNVKREVIESFNRVFGLDMGESSSDMIPDAIRDLAKLRVEAKKTHDYELADKIRRDIESQGYAVHDLKDGTIRVQKV